MIKSYDILVLAVLWPGSESFSFCKSTNFFIDISLHFIKTLGQEEKLSMLSLFLYFKKVSWENM